jgi:lipopolysaccharide transport system permease protein
LFFIVAVACLFAAIMPFFPDLRVILENGMLMIFFLSGIFFDMTKLPESVQTYLWLNPMAVIINTYRKILLKGMLPDWHQLLFVLSFSFVILLLALYLYHRFDRIYPKIIH